MAIKPNDPYSTRTGGSKTALIAGGIVLCFMIGLGIGSGKGLAGLLSFFGSQGSDPTLVGSKPNSNQLDVISNPRGSAVQLGFQPQNPAAQAIDKMPFEVRTWLKHLEETEKRRKNLAIRHLAALLTGSIASGAASMKDLAAEANGEESGQSDTAKRDQLETSAQTSRDEWHDLEVFFNSKVPPTECLSTKNSYEQCLGETGAMVSEILVQIDSSRSDPNAAVQALTGMIGTSQGRIDEAAKQTDALVAAICNRYETVKWFSLSGDFGGALGGLGALGGFGF